MLGSLDTDIQASELSGYFMNDPIDEDQLKHLGIPTTIYHESNAKERGPDTEYGLKVESPFSSSYGSMPSRAADMTLTGARPIPRKREASECYSTYAEDGSCLSSSIEEYDISNCTQFHGSPDLSPKEFKESKKVKLPGMKSSPTSYEFSSRRLASVTDGSPEPMDFELADSRKGRRRTISNTSDSEMMSKLEACAVSERKLLHTNIDQSTGKTIKLGFKTTPPTKIRPSYPNCEGSRGAIKTDVGENVELSVTTSWDDYVHAVLLIGLVLPADDAGSAAKVQPHFKTYSVGEQAGTEYRLDDVIVIGSQRRIPKGKSSLTVDVGIMRQKRDGTRAARLQRDCHIVIRLSVLKQVDGQWVEVDSAQIFTDIIKIDQPLGAPVVTNISLSRCVMAGGVYIGVKGRNLQGKSDESSVTFYDPKTKWKCKAEICEGVTTKESMLFKAPEFPVEKLYGSESYPPEVQVSFRIKVDRREAEKGTDFTYYRMENQIENGHKRHPQLSNYRQACSGKTMRRSREAASHLFPDLKDVEDILQYAEDIPAPEEPVWLREVSIPHNPNPLQSLTDYLRSDNPQTLVSGYVPGDDLSSLTDLDQGVAEVHLRENSVNSELHWP